MEHFGAVFWLDFSFNGENCLKTNDLSTFCC